MIMMNLNRIMKRIFSGLILTALAIVIFSCGDDNNLEQLRNNELALLDKYILTNYPNEEPTPSGLYYIEEVKGEGDTIVPGDRIRIFYATWLIDSTLIDQTNGYLDGYRFEPLEFVVGAGSVIGGLEEAVTYMQAGSVGNLVANSALAYGQNGNTSGNPPVPGFTTLLMQVEIYKIVEPK